jgi:hypothetical protein
MVSSARTTLSNDKNWELEDLITEFEDTFARKSSDYEQTNRVYRCIDTGDARLSDSPRRDSLWTSKQRWARCSKTSKSMGWLSSQSATGHHPVYSSGRRTGLLFLHGLQEMKCHYKRLLPITKCQRLSGAGCWSQMALHSGHEEWLLAGGITHWW